MKHRATRNWPGNYDYRGFNVLSYMSEGYGVSWYIDPIDETFEGVELDPTSTLSDAKYVIDRWHAARAG